MKPISPSALTLIKEASDGHWAQIIVSGSGITLSKLKALPDELVLTLKSNYDNFDETNIYYLKVSDDENYNDWIAVGTNYFDQSNLLYPTELDQRVSRNLMVNARKIADASFATTMRNGERWWNFIAEEVLSLVLLGFGYSIWDGSWLGNICSSVVIFFGIWAFTANPWIGLRKRNKVRNALNETNASVRFVPSAN